MRCVEAQVRDVGVTDLGIVAPAMDEGDDVVAARGEVLDQGIELRDDRLELRRRRAADAHLLHRVAQHGAVDGDVAAAGARHEGVGLAVFLELHEAERVLQRSSAARRRDHVPL